MKFKPMLAEKIDKLPSGTIDWPDWVAEQKYDGHRLLVEVTPTKQVIGWNRPRGKMGEMTTRALPTHLSTVMAKLNAGVYDGELLAGDTATDVKRLDLAEERRFVMFDVLQHGKADMVDFDCDQRRRVIEAEVNALHKACPDSRSLVECSERLNITSQSALMKWVKQIWAAGGEGVIVKKRSSKYLWRGSNSQRRSRDWVKIKRLEHFTLEVIGFEATRGTVLKRGPFAIVKLRDKEGIETTCKTKDDFELERFENDWKKTLVLTKGHPSTARGPYGEHPAMGRKLVIECGGRTRDGGYKGPVIWDRWENE